MKIVVTGYDYNDAGGQTNHHYKTDKPYYIIAAETMNEAVFLRYKEGKLECIDMLKDREVKTIWGKRPL